MVRWIVGRSAHSPLSLARSPQSRALAFERGNVLCSYDLALREHIALAKREGWDVPGNPTFVSILCDLLSARPCVCAAAMDSCADFRDAVVGSETTL